MTWSRSIDDLLPSVAGKVHLWVARCAERGVAVLVYCTWRGPEEQERLYAIGRTVAGRIVTNAKPWRSWHQYRRAIDAVPMVGGKPDWTCPVDAHGVPSEEWWRVMVEEADRVGLEWAGRWQAFREFVHFEDTGGVDFAEARRELEDSRLA